MIALGLDVIVFCFYQCVTCLFLSLCLHLADEMREISVKEAILD